MTEAELLNIPLELIEENPEQLRSVDRDADDWPDFVEDIKDNGVLLPILVKRVGEDRYVLDDGLHRFTAACEVGMETIPCRVRAEDDDRNTLLLQISANVQGVETRPAQFASAIKQILEDDPTVTIGDLSAKLHKSSSWIRKLLSLNSLCDEAKELVDKGKITLQNAYALAKLPEEVQPDWIEKAKELEPSRFVPLAQAKARELKREARQAGPAVVYRPRKKQELIDKYEAIKKQGDVEADEYLRGQLDALGWALRQDPVSEVDKEI